jgi:mannose-1-phosphate guanylyltransferase/phosphomannomutase
MGPQGQDTPKVLLEIGGQTLLEHHLRACRAAGLGDVQAVVHHLGEAVAAAGVPCAWERAPMGSGGCLRSLRLAPEVRDVVVLLGDVLIDMDLGRLLAEHRALGADATVVVHPNDHPEDSDLVSLDGRRILRIHRKPHPAGLEIANRAVAGAFVLRRALIEAIPGDAPLDLVQDLIPAEGRQVAAHNTCAYLKDAGTPSRLARVRRDWGAGRVQAARQPRPAALLDRDGTLNRLVGHLRSREQLELLEGAARAVARLNQAGVLAIVITNQPVLARGECSPEELRAIHGRLEWLLGREGAWLDGIYRCPHHPEAGWPGEVPALKIHCGCRKPATGLVEQAARELPVDLSRSAVFGDSERDAGLAGALGLPFFQVGPAPLLHQVERWLGG